MLVFVVVWDLVLCAESEEAVDHIRFLDELKEAVGQGTGPLLTLRVEVAHTDLLVNEEEVKVDHILCHVTAREEYLWTANHTEKIPEQAVDMYSN
jgi:hypothetical protein